jgi:tripartite-type tricarboxylate transporter receptor subunit TctC
MPKGTPDAIVQRLREATIAAMETPSVKEQLLNARAIVVAPERRTTEYLKQFVDSELQKNAGPIRAADISIE